jgi:hypothetical protein
MTAHREQWYRDRLRAELERVAAIEDRRERRGVLGGVRLPLKPVLAIAAIAVALALAVALLGSGTDERSAAPPKPRPTPAPSPAAGTPQAVLQRLDGVYTAQITTSVIAGTQLLPTGWWRITIRAADAGFVLTAPDAGGDYPHTITGVSPGRLAFAPDGNCEVPAQRQDPATVEFALRDSHLTLRGVRGGCRPIWRLMTSASWYRTER